MLREIWGDVVGITVSSSNRNWVCGVRRLPVELRLQDYRDWMKLLTYCIDRMFEHVGRETRLTMQVCTMSDDDGLFLFIPLEPHV